MKRQLTAMLAVTLAITGLVGCQDSASEETQSISVWLPPFAAESAEASDLEVWNEIMAPFEAEHDVDVQVTIIPWESFEERFLTGFSSGDGPDIGYMYAEMVADYITRDQLAPVGQYITDDMRESYHFLDLGVYGDEQYGLPIIVGGARLLYYNKDLLDSVGAEPPRTWDDFVETSIALREAGYTPFVAPWGDPAPGVLGVNYFPFLWQAGGDIANEDGTEAAFNSGAGLRAAQFIHDLRFEHGILDDQTTATNSNDSLDQFSQGDVGFVITSDAFLSTFQEAGINVGVVDSLEDQEKGTFVAVDVLVMADKAPDKELAAALMRHMLSGPSMDQFHSLVAYPPISDQETTTVDPLLEQIYGEDSDILRQYPVIANSAPLYSSLYENLQQMLLGTKTPEQALADAERAANESLSQNKSN